jgi:hypothetical protein
VSRPELGVECSCGFKRRGTPTYADGSYNGRDIEGLHCFQIDRENVERKARDEAPSVHNMSMGLIADMTWPALTAEEQSIGEAYLVGYREGQRVLKIRLKDRLAAVTAQEFGT